MAFINEIKCRKDELFSLAELKEKCFYLYLSEGKAVLQITEQLSPIDEICFEVFSKSGKNLHDKIKVQLEKRSLKGMHITNNPIALTAICLYDENLKENYLTSYFNQASIKNRFLINRLFPEFKLISNEKAISDFEYSILPLIIDLNRADALNYFYEALKKTEDLTDIYILDKLYQQYLTYQPITKVLENLSSTKELLKSLHKRITFFVSITEWFVFIVLIPYLSYCIYIFLNENYERFNLTRLSIIIPIVFSFLSISVLFLRKKLKWIDNFIDGFEELLFKIYYSLLGIRYCEVKKAISIETNNFEIEHTVKEQIQADRKKFK